jgi:hypothetical protein
MSWVPGGPRVASSGCMSRPSRRRSRTRDKYRRATAPLFAAHARRRAPPPVPPGWIYRCPAARRWRRSGRQQAHPRARRQRYPWESRRPTSRLA